MIINWNSYHAKKLKSAIILFLICLIICTLIIVMIVHKAIPIKPDDCKMIDITVQKVEYESWHKPGICRIYSDKEDFVIFSNSIFSAYDASNAISVGDKLDIIYTEVFSFTGNYNYVVDARNDGVVYVDFNEEAAPDIFPPLITAVLILLILSCFGYNVYSKYRDLKKNSKK